MPKAKPAPKRKTSSRPKNHWTTIAIFTSSLLLIITLVAANYTTVKTSSQAVGRRACGEFCSGNSQCESRKCMSGRCVTGPGLVCPEAVITGEGNRIGFCQVGCSASVSGGGTGGPQCEPGLICSRSEVEPGVGGFRCKCANYSGFEGYIHPRCKRKIDEVIKTDGIKCTLRECPSWVIGC